LIKIFINNIINTIKIIINFFVKNNKYNMIENEPTFELPNNITGNNNNNSNTESHKNNNKRLNDFYLSKSNFPVKPKQNHLTSTNINNHHNPKNNINNTNLNALDLNSQIYQTFLLNPIFERRKKRRSSTYLSTVGVNTNSNTNNNNENNKKRNSIFTNNNNNGNMQNKNIILEKNKKKKKSVTFKDPFIMDIPIESLKEFNLKMTYDSELVPDLLISDRICPCKFPCIIF